MDRSIYPRDLERLRKNLRKTKDRLDAKERELVTLGDEIRELEQAMSLKKTELTITSTELRRKRLQQPKLDRMTHALQRSWRKLEDDMRRFRM